MWNEQPWTIIFVYIYWVYWQCIICTYRLNFLVVRDHLWNGNSPPQLQSSWLHSTRGSRRSKYKEGRARRIAVQRVRRSRAIHCKLLMTSRPHSIWHFHSKNGYTIIHCIDYHFNSLAEISKVPSCKSVMASLFFWRVQGTVFAWLLPLPLDKVTPGSSPPVFTTDTVKVSFIILLSIAFQTLGRRAVHQVPRYDIHKAYNTR